MCCSNRLVTNLTGIILGQATAAIHVHWQPWGACKGEGGWITGSRRQVQLAWAEKAVWEGLLVILWFEPKAKVHLPGVVSRGSCSHSVVTAGGGGQARCCGAEEHLRQGALVCLLAFVKHQLFKGSSVPGHDYIKQTSLRWLLSGVRRWFVSRGGEMFWRCHLVLCFVFVKMNFGKHTISRFEQTQDPTTTWCWLLSPMLSRWLFLVARLSALNPHTEDVKIILGSTLCSTLLHRDDQVFLPALPWASRWCFWAARLKSARQEEESWMRWTRIILWSVNSLYRPYKGIVIVRTRFHS